MPHDRNVQALAELLFRVEHVDMGITPAFDLLGPARKELYRRRAAFLSNRGVAVAAAVAADLVRALELPDEPDADERLRERIEAVARGEHI